jgi:hypothetical protein
MAEVVDAVVVRRFIGTECPACGGTLFALADPIFLGTVLRVDLSSRQVQRLRSHGVEFDCEVVSLVGMKGWIPTELLMRGGRSL